MTARIGGEGRPLRALALLGMGLLGYAIGRAPAVIERIGQDAAVMAAAGQPAQPPPPPSALPKQIATAEVEAAPALTPSLDSAPSFPGKREPISPATANRQRGPAFPGMTRNGRQLRMHTGSDAAAAPDLPAANFARQNIAEGPPAGAAPPPQAPTASGTSAPTAFGLATAAYAALTRNDRRSAARDFDAAVAADPAAANAPLWQAERRRLGRRWSGQAWTLLRDGGGTLAAASPVLGGGQSGANLGYILDPLAKRPLALVARVAVPNSSGSVRPIDVTQFALGVEWQPVRGVRVSAERLIAGGPYARNDFALRLGGGASGERARLAWSGYGEAGVIGLKRGDAYAGGEAKLGWHGPALGRFDWTAGGGVWGSAQWAGGWSTRLDAGPTLAIRLPLGRASLTAAADYRFRLAGNALPGSGPAVTLSTAF